MAEPYHSLLRSKRERIGIPMSRLAAEIGVAGALYSQIEGRVKPAPLKAAFAISDFHGADVVELFDSNGFALRCRDSEEFDENQLSF